MRLTFIFSIAAIILILWIGVFVITQVFVKPARSSFQEKSLDFASQLIDIPPNINDTYKSESRDKLIVNKTWYVQSIELSLTIEAEVKDFRHTDDVFTIDLTENTGTGTIEGYRALEKSIKDERMLKKLQQTPDGYIREEVDSNEDGGLEALIVNTKGLQSVFWIYNQDWINEKLSLNNQGLYSLRDRINHADLSPVVYYLPVYLFPLYIIESFIDPGAIIGPVFFLVLSAVLTLALSIPLKIKRLLGMYLLFVILLFIVTPSVTLILIRLGLLGN